MSESTQATKAQRAFWRKLYLAHLIASDRHNLASLTQVSGMPRRTVQDTLADLADIGICCQFEQQDGGRNNQGCYRIVSWGPINPDWVEEHLPTLVMALQPQ